MGIKTIMISAIYDAEAALKNLPTTWGLRPVGSLVI